MHDAVTLRRLIRTRQISCVEVMNAHLDRIEALNPKVNAIVALQDRAQLIRQAQDCDARLTKDETIGALHGFPHAVKDMAPVRGIAFTQGSPIFRDLVATEDSLQTERLRRAGVIFIGKTNTPEFGLGSHTFNPVYGATRNAYDPTRSAGGSSGGAAVALALGMVPLADGSDYGGSLRNPAGWNNVYGFRPSIGRVPSHGKDDWLPTMGTSGPMARTVADLALLLSVQAGHDPRAPLSMEGSGDIFAGELGANMKGKRIAWAGDFNGAIPYEAGVLDTCRTAFKAFETIGAHVEEQCPDYPLDKVWDAFVELRSWQQGGGLAALAADPATRTLLKPEALYEIDQCRAFRLRHQRPIGDPDRMEPGGTEILRTLRLLDHADRPDLPLRDRATMAGEHRRRGHAHLSRMDEGALPGDDGRLSGAGRARRLRAGRAADGAADHRTDPP